MGQQTSSAHAPLQAAATWAASRRSPTIVLARSSPSTARMSKTVTSHRPLSSSCRAEGAERCGEAGAQAWQCRARRGGRQCAAGSSTSHTQLQAQQQPPQQQAQLPEQQQQRRHEQQQHGSRRIAAAAQKQHSSSSSSSSSSSPPAPQGADPQSRCHRSPGSAASRPLLPLACAAPLRVCATVCCCC